MPIITAKILDTPCKSCGYATIAWWNKILSKKRLCIDCHKEQLRQKNALKPPGKKLRAKRADLALFEMIGSKNISREFAEMVTEENSKTVLNKAVDVLFKNTNKRNIQKVLFSEVMVKLSVKKKRGPIRKRITPIEQRPMRVNLNKNRKEINLHGQDTE